MRLARGVLRDRDETRHAAALLVLATYEIARTFRRDEHHVEILARLDLLEVNVEAVREEQGGALLQALLHSVIQRFLREVRHQHRDKVSTLCCLRGLGHGETFLLRLLPALAVLSHPDHDVEARVLQVQRMRAALTAIPEDGDASALERFLVDVFLPIQLHQSAPSWNRPQCLAECIKNPAAALWPVRGSLVFRSLCLVSGVHECPALTAPKEEQYERRYEQRDATHREDVPGDGSNLRCECHVRRTQKEEKSDGTMS